MTETISATLQYLARDPVYDTQKPFQILIDLSHVPGAKPSNHKHEAIENVTITNVRKSAEQPTLDKNGFQLELLPNIETIQPTQFHNEDWILKQYYPFIEGFLKRLLDAQEVRIFEHQLRYRQPGFGIGKNANRQLRPDDAFAPPVPVVHSDQSRRAARARFPRHWPNFSEEMWKDRWQVINVWLPLNDVVTEWPLAFCDCRSVDVGDLRESDLVRKDYHGESVLATYNPRHRWYYADRQKFGEAWVMKLYDSDPQVASTTLHTAIDIGPGDSGRRSCEIRALVHR